MRSAARSALVYGALALVGLSAGLAGCTPESRNTLPEKDRIAPDERLIGRWHATVDGADYVAEVTRADALTLNVALVETLPVGKRPVTRTGYRAGVYTVGSRTILAAQDVEPTPGNWRFAVMLFSGDDRVTLMFMDEHYVFMEVNRAAFPGTIRTNDPMFPDVVITASSTDLEAFIRSASEGRMFTVPFGPFERQP